ncbi:hypothetical protein HZR84_00815 [Hyphobacterium sp. CCMP332]|nr:hypothetical protein HZR84_00815 [Hyphobacterium sp. CCMP332]
MDPDGKRHIALGPNENPNSEHTGNHVGNEEKEEVQRDNSKITVEKTTTENYGNYKTKSEISGNPENISNISDFSSTVLASSMRESNTKSINVTSTVRTPEQQSAAMYNNIIKLGATSQYALYGSAGDQVINVFENMGPNWNCSKSETIKSMTDKINEIGPEKVSNHIGDPSKNNIIDAVGSNGDQLSGSFHNSLINNTKVQKLLTPYNSKDPVFHIEIKQ